MHTKKSLSLLAKWAFTFVFLLFGSTLYSQTELNEKLPVDPAIKIGKLSNGLTYYIRKNSKPENKVELRLVVNAGSILEDDDQQGLAHFTEHMAFNGTKNFQKNDLVSFLQSIGVEFGADLNAYTSFDETVYILPIPTDKPDNLEKGFQILEDWASTVTFDNGEIDKERGVVLEESRLGKGADDRMSKVYLPKLFIGSQYAERLPIGKDDILKSFKYDAIKRFYKDWYRPNLMAVIAVGDVEPAELEKMITKHFAGLKNPTNERKRISAELPPRNQSEGVVVTDPEATNFFVQIYYSTEKSQPETTVGDYRQSIVKRLFTSMLSQRMQELTQKPAPPFIFGSSSLGGFLRGTEVYSSFAVLTQAGIEPAVNAVIQENERARKYGFTAAEFDRTKKSLLRSMERSYNEREKTESSNFASEFIRSFLDQEPIPGIEKEYAYYQKFLEEITLAEVNRYVKETIPAVDKHKLVLMTGPEKAPFAIPSGEELLAMADRASKMEVAPYEEAVVAASLMTKTPTPGKIASETKNEKLGTTVLKLSNGVTVTLKSTDFKNDQVVMSATRPGGQYLYGDADILNAQYASTIVSQMGAGEFSPTDMRKVLAGKTVGVSPRIGTSSEAINGQSGSKDVEALLQMTYLYFTQPRKDVDLFNSFVSKQSAMYQNILSDPNAVFQNEFLKIVYNNNPRGPKFPSPDDFGKINMDRSFEIYKERFGNANGFHFYIVGSFDVNEIKPLLATYLGSLPTTGKTSNFKDIGLRPVKGVVKKEVRKGTEQKSMIRMMFSGETPYSLKEEIKLSMLAEVLNIKVIETLREDMSGVYGAGVNAGLSKIPYSGYSASIAMPCGPENVDKLIVAALAEVDKVKKSGPTKEDLEKVKETLKQQYLESMKDNNYWVRNLQGADENGTPSEAILTYLEDVQAVNEDDLKKAANKYFDMKNYIQVVLYPETDK